MRKWLNVKTLGLLAVAGAALLFAGCNQQAEQQTPPPGGPTTVAVEGLYDRWTSRPVDPNNVNGQVIVRAKVSVGSVVPDKIQFLLDDSVEYEVDFGVATEGVRSQQSEFTFEWNLETRALDDFTPKYLNGPHTVKVQLVKDGNVVAASEATNVVFNNEDFALLKVSGNAINYDGKRYYGGQDLIIEVVPVLYSGKGLASVSLNVEWWGADADLTPDSTVVQSQTLTSAPYVFTLPYNDNNKSALTGANRFSWLQVTITYEDSTTFGGVEAVIDGDQVLVDNTGLFSNSPPFGLSNLRADFQGPQGVSSAEVCRDATPLSATDYWASTSNLKAGVDDIDDFTESLPVTAVLDVKTTTSSVVESDVEIGLEDTGCGWVGALTGVPEGGFFKVYVKALKDALGNTTTFSPAYESVAFGIDETKPTLELNAGWASKAYFNSASLNTGSVAGYDLNGNATSTPADITDFASIEDPAAGTPPVASGVAGYKWTVDGKEISSHSTSDLPGLDDLEATLGSAPQGYYTLTVQAVDRAGNVSDPFTLEVLYDNTEPNVLFTSPATTALTGGATFVATASATDNVDLRQGRIYWSYSANIRFEAFHSPVKEFGKPASTSEDYSVSLTAIKPSAGGDFALFAWVQDQGRNALATADLSTLSVTPANSNSAGTVGAVTETPDIDAAGGGSTTLTISTTPGTANVSAVKIYMKNPGITLGGYIYYDYSVDARSLGGGDYAATVTVPAGVSAADAEFLIVVLYDNGLAIGYTYNYDSGTLTNVF